MSKLTVEEKEITLPKWNPLINSQGKVNGIFKFTMTNTNVSVANALRRTILSDIPTVIIKDFNIINNNTQFNNQILEQRLSMIPLKIDPDEPGMAEQIKNLQLIIEENNDGTELKYITTAHFMLFEKTSEKYIATSTLQNIFPTNNITKEHILFCRLKPKLSNEIPGENIHIKANLGIGTAAEKGCYNVVSTCAYGFTPDKSEIHNQRQKYEDELTEKGIIEKDIEDHLTNWDNHNYKRYYLKNSFDFSIESIGIFKESDIIFKACNIINFRLMKMKQNEDENQYTYKKNNIALENSVDITLHNTEYTIGKLLEFIIYQEYFINQKVLSFCGFLKPHPHEDDSIIRIAFNKEKNFTDDNIENIITDSCGVGQQIFTSIQSDFSQ